jgi:hypothetical protein
MSFEHLDGAIIRAISVIETTDKSEWIEVGNNGITRIEAFTKSGLHADIPYVRAWKGEHPYAEFCQHNVLGVYFAAQSSA